MQDILMVIRVVLHSGLVFEQELVSHHQRQSCNPVYGGQYARMPLLLAMVVVTRTKSSGKEARCDLRVLRVKTFQNWMT